MNYNKFCEYTQLIRTQEFGELALISCEVLQSLLLILIFGVFILFNIYCRWSKKKKKRKVQLEHTQNFPLDIIFLKLGIFKQEQHLLPRDLSPKKIKNKFFGVPYMRALKIFNSNH